MALCRILRSCFCSTGDDSKKRWRHEPSLRSSLPQHDFTTSSSAFCLGTIYALNDHQFNLPEKPLFIAVRIPHRRLTMAPVRRYLRITKYSVLECRIYLDNPALVHSWLLNPRDPVLPRVIEGVRPWVLPKLREEKERSRKKSSTKKKAIKDVITQGKFGYLCSTCDPTSLT